jgi:hypothetical protein
MDSTHCRKFYFDQPGFGPLGQRQLAVVHRVCGRQPVSIGTYPLVPDGGHPRQVRCSEKVLAPFLARLPHDRLLVAACRLAGRDLQLGTRKRQKQFGQNRTGKHFIYAARFRSFERAGSDFRSVSELMSFSLSIKKISRTVPSCITVLTVIFFSVTLTTK